MARIGKLPSGPGGGRVLRLRFQAPPPLAPRNPNPNPRTAPSPCGRAGAAGGPGAPTLWAAPQPRGRLRPPLLRARPDRPAARPGLAWRGVAWRVGVLRGDHGCRLLPPVPTVTIESHGCPGDAGAGRAVTQRPGQADVRPGGGRPCARPARPVRGCARPRGSGRDQHRGQRRAGAAGRGGGQDGLRPPSGRGPRAAGPGVGGRDWRLLLRAARAVSSLEPRCRRAARAGVPPRRRPGLQRRAGGAAAPPPPPTAPRTGTRPLTSEPRDVKAVLAGGASGPAPAWS